MSSSDYIHLHIHVQPKFEPNQSNEAARPLYHDVSYLNTNEQVLSHDDQLTRSQFITQTTPLRQLKIYKNDIRVIRKGETSETRRGGGIKGKITTITDDSLRELKFLIDNTYTQLHSLVTLTYNANYPKDGLTVKKHLNALLTAMRRRYGEWFAYVWVLEFQLRGAPHIHILTNVNLREVSLPDFVVERTCNDKNGIETSHEHNLLETVFLIQAWQRIASKAAGISTWEVLRVADGAAKYMGKTSQNYQKQVPDDFANIGRAWGASRNVRVGLGEPSVIATNDNEAMQRVIGSNWKGKTAIKNMGYLPKVLHGASKFFSEV